MKVGQQLKEYSQKVVFSLFGLVREREKISHREGDTWKGILQAERIFFGKFLVFFWRGY